MRISEYEHSAEIDGYHAVITAVLARQGAVYEAANAACEKIRGGWGLCLFGFVRRWACRATHPR